MKWEKRKGFLRLHPRRGVSQQGPGCTFHVQSVQLLRVGIKQATRSSAAAHWLSSPHGSQSTQGPIFKECSDPWAVGVALNATGASVPSFCNPLKRHPSGCVVQSSVALILYGMLGWTHLPLAHPEGSHVPLTTGGEKRPRGGIPFSSSHSGPNGGEFKECSESPWNSSFGLCQMQWLTSKG